MLEAMLVAMLYGVAGLFSIVGLITMALWWNVPVWMFVQTAKELNRRCKS